MGLRDPGALPRACPPSDVSAKCAAVDDCTWGPAVRCCPPMDTTLTDLVAITERLPTGYRAREVRVGQFHVGPRRPMLPAYGYDADRPRRDHRKAPHGLPRPRVPRQRSRDLGRGPQRGAPRAAAGLRGRMARLGEAQPAGGSLPRRGGDG